MPKLANVLKLRRLSLNLSSDIRYAQMEWVKLRTSAGVLSIRPCSSISWMHRRG